MGLYFWPCKIALCQLKSQNLFPRDCVNKNTMTYSGSPRCVREHLLSTEKTPIITRNSRIWFRRYGESRQDQWRLEWPPEDGRESHQLGMVTAHTRDSPCPQPFILINSLSPCLLSEGPPLALYGYYFVRLICSYSLSLWFKESKVDIVWWLKWSSFDLLFIYNYIIVPVGLSHHSFMHSLIHMLSLKIHIKFLLWVRHSVLWTYKMKKIIIYGFPKSFYFPPWNTV